jgi:hypothetical protein
MVKGKQKHLKPVSEVFVDKVDCAHAYVERGQGNNNQWKAYPAQNADYAHKRKQRDATEKKSTFKDPGCVLNREMSSDSTSVPSSS